MDKNQSKMVSPNLKQTFSWKTFIVALIVAAFLNSLISAIFYVEPRKNIIWTIWWLYLSIKAWKLWKWKALLPYPLFIVLNLILSAFGFNKLSWSYVILKIFLNIGGLITFYLLLRNTQHNHDTSEGTLRLNPEAHETIDSVLTKVPKVHPKANYSLNLPQKFEDEERAYEEIAKEIETGAVDKGLWTRLFVECDGDERKTKLLYIKQRLERLVASKHSDIEKKPIESSSEIGVDGLENNNIKPDYWSIDENKSPKRVAHDHFSDELKRIERRTMARIRASYLLAFDPDSDK